MKKKAKYQTMLEGLHQDQLPIYLIWFASVVLEFRREIALIQALASFALFGNPCQNPVQYRVRKSYCYIANDSPHIALLLQRL
jgi:hypothetical protein